MWEGGACQALEHRGAIRISTLTRPLYVPREPFQWEDFGNEHAFAISRRYKATLPSYNDDIEASMVPQKRRWESSPTYAFLFTAGNCGCDPRW